MEKINKVISLVFIVSCLSGCSENNCSHNFGNATIVNESTCSVKGSKTSACTLCGYVKNEEIPLNNAKHSFGEWDELDNDKHIAYCDCGETKTENHKLTLKETITNPTSNTVGTGIYSCSVCGCEIEKEIPKLNLDDLSITNEKLTVKFNKKGAKIDSIRFDDRKIAENGFVAGRVANRIANATFTLDGKTYNVNKNNGKHCLHGGSKGFGEIDWTVDLLTTNSIRFKLVSEDGDQGFPGKMNVSVTYTVTSGNILIEYSAKSDKKTIFNPTNHLYMNLNGIGTNNVINHELWIDANTYTKADSELIPTGEIVSVSGTKLDYSTIRDYKGDNDANLVLNGEGYRRVATMIGKSSCIAVEVSTDRPGLQLYNNNSAICLETQAFPDAVHHDNFPSIVLNANEEFNSKTCYSFDYVDR